MRFTRALVFASAALVTVHATAGAAEPQRVVTPTHETNLLVFPIVGRVVGANGTFFRTDLSILNSTAFPNVLELQFFAANGNTDTPPAARVLVALAPNEHRYLFDVMQKPLSTESGSGALRIVSERPVIAVANIYNDQRARDAGTFGQFVQGQRESQTRTHGVLPMLSNVQDPSGRRANIGWYNDGHSVLNVTFRAHRANGSAAATVTRAIPPGEQRQLAAGQLFSNLEPLENMYVSFTSEGGPLYVYASSIDNTSGDAMFIPAQGD